MTTPTQFESFDEWVAWLVTKQPTFLARAVLEHPLVHEAIVEVLEELLPYHPLWNRDAE